MSPHDLTQLRAWLINERRLYPAKHSDGKPHECWQQMNQILDIIEKLMEGKT